MAQTFQQIVDRVRLIVQDVPSELDAEIPKQVNRAQEDAEDSWEHWPFLNHTLTWNISADAIARLDIRNDLANNADLALRRWLRWRYEDPCFYTTASDPVQAMKEIPWGLSEFIVPAQAPRMIAVNGAQSRADIREHRIQTEVTVVEIQQGRPQRIGVTEDSNVGDQSNLAIAAPTTAYLTPEPDQSYRIQLPCQVREEELVLGFIEHNFWTRELPRYLENSAAANTLAENQDPRSFDYQNRALVELQLFRRKWQRRQLHLADGFVPKTDVFATRNQRSLS